MASALPRLLCYGHDDMLLFTRKKILEQEFSVDVCTRISELDAVLARGRIDIAVVCQSVPDAECEEMMHRLREHSPGVKVLVLYASTPDLCSSHSDESMENLEGPSTLLHKVHELMKETAHDSARRE
jgi:DNA-binding NtrC family response regulator